MNFIGPLWMYALLDEICELLYILEADGFYGLLILVPRSCCML